MPGVTWNPFGGIPSPVKYLADQLTDGETAVSSVLTVSELALTEVVSAVLLVAVAGIPSYLLV